MAAFSHCLIIVKALAAGAVGIVGVQLCVAHVVANTRVIALQCSKVSKISQVSRHCMGARVLACVCRVF